MGPRTGVRRHLWDMGPTAGPPQTQARTSHVIFQKTLRWLVSKIHSATAQKYNNNNIGSYSTSLGEEVLFRKRCGNLNEVLGGWVRFGYMERKRPCSLCKRKGVSKGWE